MLRVEKLNCLNTKFNKDCEWVNVPISYPDTRYLLLKQRLIYEVKNTKVAYRITHNKFGILCTLKWGHDKQLFIQDNQEALRAFALY